MRGNPMKDIQVYNICLVLCKLCTVGASADHALQMPLFIRAPHSLGRAKVLRQKGFRVFLSLTYLALFQYILVWRRLTGEAIILSSRR